MRNPITEPLVFDTNRGLAILFMVVSSVVISFGGLIIRSIEAATPWQINFYRSLALLGVVSVFILIRFGRESLTTIGNIGGRGCLAGLFFGFAGLAFLQALTRTTVANTLFILGAIPFFAAVLARILLNEKISRATALTMCAAAVGLVVMVMEGIVIGLGLGNGFALLTAIFFALYAVILRSARQREMLPVLLISSLVVIAVSAVVLAGDLAISVRDCLLSFLWGGLLSGVANWMFIYASRHLAAAEVTLFMLLEFALGPVWVWLVIREQPSRGTIIGGLLIVLAVSVRALIELKSTKRTEDWLPQTPRTPVGPV